MKQLMTVVLECKGLSKEFRGVSVLRDLTFEIDAGNAMLIKGENGAGKTTLLSILAGLVQPTAGEIRLEGKAFDSTFHALRRSIGISPASENSLFLNASVRENLRFWHRLQGLAGSDATLIENLATNWDFVVYLDRPARELSSGFRRRVALARAFLHRPKLVLLDEPLAFLDNEHQERTIELCEKWLRESGGALVMTSNLEFKRGSMWRSLELKSISNLVSAR